MIQKPVSPIDLPPELRSRLRRLSLSPQRPARAGALGVHVGRTRGGGAEFAQYRPYQWGDDLRQIDWRLYARSDHFFVRDAERESPTGLWLLLDTSASMGQTDQARPDWSRLDGAKLLAAALLEVALKDGDRFGLVVVTADGASATRLGAGARHRDLLLAKLSRVASAGIAQWQMVMERAAEQFQPGDILVVLSDGFDEACMKTIERLAGAGRDVALVQILTADERDFPFTDGCTFIDPETGARAPGDGPTMRQSYLARFAQARAAQAERLQAAGARRVEHFLDVAADTPIRALFAAERR